VFRAKAMLRKGSYLHRQWRSVKNASACVIREIRLYWNNPPARPVGGAHNGIFCGVGVLLTSRIVSRRVCPGWRVCRGVFWRCVLLPLLA
jgi:hypothetical protein